MRSSSKRKSSRKKSSKLNSQSRRIKKNRKNKSKKLSCRHDSSDDFTSSKSISSRSDDSHFSESFNDSLSSSSQDSYRSRKKVSHLQSKTKSRGRRARRRYSSTESGEEVSLIKKRKQPRKNAGPKSRNKSRKKKLTRDMSTSSESSDSYSCSTCKGGSSNVSEESGLQRHRIRSTKNKKNKLVSCNERIESKKRSHRSPSCSSYGKSRDQSYSVSQADKKFMGETMSKRLRSVITVVEQFDEKEENKLEKDSLKEEMVYDRDDYPSSRSNDSGGGGNQRDLTAHSPVASDGKRQEFVIKGEETFACNHRLPEPSESRKDVHDQNVYPSFNKVETNNSEKETRAGASLTSAGFGGDYLEAALRQKALENLRKFRGGPQTSVKTTADQPHKDDGDTNQSSTVRAEIVQSELPKQDNAGMIGSVQLLDRSMMRTLEGEVAYFTKAVGDISDGGYTGKKSKSLEQNTIHPTEGLGLSGNTSKADHTQSVAVNCEPGTSSLREQSTGTNSALNQTMITQASPDKNQTENKESEGKNLPGITRSMSPSVKNNQGTGVHNNSSSATAELASSAQSTSGGQGSNDHRDEAKDGSQFEQKTMSVMRGGEMVQVNYKVYIPKRAPALSRRQLKR